MHSAKRLALVSLFGVLTGSYILLLFAIFNPRVDPEYKAYYIEKRTIYWRPRRYSADLSDGIDFRKEGLPRFVRYITGISRQEPWGRWTDSMVNESATIEYMQAWEEDVCILITARPSEDQLGRNTLISMGRNTKTIHINNARSTTYRVSIQLDAPTDTLTIMPESPSPFRWDPRGMRGRRLGLALEKILVRTGNCGDESTRE